MAAGAQGRRVPPLSIAHSVSATPPAPRGPMSTISRLTYGIDSMEQRNDKMLSDSYLREWPSPEMLEMNLEVDCMECFYKRNIPWIVAEEREEGER